MPTETGSQPENEVGKNVRSSDITASLFLSWVFALVISIAPNMLSVALFGSDGSEAVNRFSDGLFAGWFVMIFPTILTYNGIGYIAARTTVSAGPLNYFWCVLQSILIIGVVHMIVMIFIYFSSIRDHDLQYTLLIPVLVSMQYAVVCGVLGGSFFWLYMLYKYPELRPPKMKTILTAVASALTYSVAIIVGWFAVLLFVTHVIL